MPILDLDYPGRLLAIQSQNQADDISENIIDIISHKSEYIDSQLDIINTALTELSNVNKHSEEKNAIIAAETSKDYVQFAIGDAGLGIPVTLNNKYRIDIKDKYWITMSIDPYITGKTEGHHGTGLTDLCESILEYEKRGFLIIRSNAGTMIKRGEPIIRSCGNIPGTYIGIFLKTGEVDNT